MSAPARGKRRLSRDHGRAYRALLRAFLLVDLRGQHYGSATGVKAGESVPPLYFVFAQYLTVSALLTAILFARVDAAFFALASLSLHFVLIVSALIVELDEAIFDPLDREIIAHRPVAPSVYAAARLTNLLAYVALMSVGLIVFPAIVGAALVDAGPFFAPAYLFAAGVTSVSASALVVLAHTSGAPLEAVRTGLAWVQILLVMALFYGGQLMLRNADGALELFAAFPPWWVGRLPTAWLAAWVAEAASGATLATAEGGAIACAVTCALGGAAVLRLRATYARHGGVARRVAQGGRSARFGRWALVGSRSRRLGFALGTMMLRRDSDLRFRALPSVAPLIAATAVLALTDQHGDPFVTASPSVVLPLALPALIAGAVPGVLFALRFSRHADASWILRAAPIPDRAAFRAGLADAVLALVFSPLVIAIVAVLAWLWRAPLHALAIGAVLALVVLAAARVCVRTALPDVPLAQPASRGEMSGSIAMTSALVGAVASLVGAALFALASVPHGAWIGCAVTCLVAGIVALAASRSAS